MFLYRLLCVRHRRGSLGVLVLVLTVLGLLYHMPPPRQLISRISTGAAVDYTTAVPGTEEFANTVASLWKPFKIDINASNFTTRTGREYEVDRRLWTKPLGSDVLILDSDTRFDDLRPLTTLDEKTLTPRRAGRLNHYIYALIHGYDYMYMHAPGYWFRHNTWSKVPMMRRALKKKYKFIVFLDGDAVFAEPHVPVEWLLNLWNIHNGTLLAMTEDPNHGGNWDSKHWVVWNTGFMIAQAGKRTEGLFDMWENCPFNPKFPDCGHWDQDFSHEQAVFGNYIRYEYNKTDELRAIPCMDGNGAWYIPEKKECGGMFITHHWSQEKWTVDNLREMVTRPIAMQLKDGTRDPTFKALMRMNPARSHMTPALNDVLMNLDQQFF